MYFSIQGTKKKFIYVIKDVSYLRPFVQQVTAELKEKDDWNSGKLE